MGDVEIVAVDDASTDGTADVLERLAQENPCLKVVRHDRNLGVGEARNTALRHALGEFVAWVDADDEVLEGWYATITAHLALARDEGWDVLTFGARTSARNDAEGIVRYVTQVRIVPAMRYLKDCLRDIGGSTWLWNKVFRRELFAGALFAGRTQEDFRILPRVLARAQNVCAMPDILYRYNRPVGSLTHDGGGGVNAEGILAAIRDSLDDVPDRGAVLGAWKAGCALRAADWLLHSDGDVELRRFVRHDGWRVLIDFRNGWRAKVKCLLAMLCLRRKRA